MASIDQVIDTEEPVFQCGYDATVTRVRFGCWKVELWSRYCLADDYLLVCAKWPSRFVARLSANYLLRHMRQVIPHPCEVENHGR